MNLEYTHQDSNLKPSVPKTDALSSCAMGAVGCQVFIENSGFRQLPLAEDHDLGPLFSRFHCDFGLRFALTNCPNSNMSPRNKIHCFRNPFFLSEFR